MHSFKIISTTILIIFLSSFTTLLAQVSKPNVIMIISDDLNDYIGTMDGHPQVSTPNIDRLAQMGTTFMNTYASASGCGPSRCSIFSGKDLAYTQVYNNADYENIFRSNFTEEKNNAEVYSFPEMLKDSGGYYTYAINKNYHHPDKNDFDKTTPNACAKTLSWNRMSNFIDDSSLINVQSNYNFLGSLFQWGAIPNDMESQMQDYKAADTAIAFIKSIANGTGEDCGNPFYLGLGFNKPHSYLYVPRKYFPEYYVNNFYYDPDSVSPLMYNHPPDAYPYNGVVMPPQPVPVWDDYNHLSPLGKMVAEFGSIETYIDLYLSNKLFATGEIRNMVAENIRASNVSAYIAGVQFVDAQIGRVLDSLMAYPEIFDNTIIIFISDHGFSLGEKKHWTKWSLWETDTRCPMIIVHPDVTGNRVVNKAVSYLDLFPTILSLTSTDIPDSESGGTYPDGKDISDLLFNNALDYELPQLTSYKRTNGNGSCFPMFSVSNERFHLIRYRNNDDNADPLNCDPDSKYFEQEFYDVGLQRETDPNEWNNLVNNNQYKPMMEFLAQWIPDSIFYMTPTMKIFPQLTEDLCYFNFHDTIHLTATFNNAEGLPVDELIAGQQIIWFATWMDDTLHGKDISLELNSINDTIFLDSEKDILYAGIWDSSMNTLIALTALDLYVGTGEQPELLYTIEPSYNNTVLISDIEFTGTYNKAIWDFGDGYIYTGITPPKHQYSTSGTYLITTKLLYGNDCKVVKENEFTTSDFSEFNNTMMVFPNPATSGLNITIFSEETSGRLDFYDATGRLMMGYQYRQQFTGEYFFDVSKFASGLYFVRMENASNVITKSFIKQ